MNPNERINQILELMNRTQNTTFIAVDKSNCETATAYSENIQALHDFGNYTIYGSIEDKIHMPLLLGILALDADSIQDSVPNPWLTYLEGSLSEPPNTPILEQDKTYRLCQIGSYDTNALEEVLQLASEVLMPEPLYLGNEFILLLLEAHTSLNETLSAFYETAALELGQTLSLYLSTRALSVDELPDAYATIKGLEKLLPADSTKTPVFFEAHLSELLFDEWLSHKPGPIFKAVRRQGLANHLDDETLRTIDMLFQMNLNLTDTARALFIHRNTLIYRLDKIEKQLGFDLRQFEDCFQLKLLLRIK